MTDTGLLKKLEAAESGSRVALTELLDALPYNEQGLIAAIAQDVHTQEVLMLAWMDRHAIETTLADGYACYYSRSRKSFWKKGETSGHVQKLINMRFDCDGDALLVTVEQSGPACHTLRTNCFYLQVDGNSVEVIAAPETG